MTNLRKLANDVKVFGQ